MKLNYICAPGIPEKHFKRKSDEQKKDEIINTICIYFGVNRADLVGDRRFQDIVLPRQVSMVMLRKFTTFGVAKIAGVFNRDHTTVVHATKKVRELCRFDPIVQKIVSEVENRILS